LLTDLVGRGAVNKMHFGVDYEFRNIESLIRNAISLSGKSKKSLNQQFVATRTAVAKEKARARNSLAIQAATLGCKDQIMLYIRYHQHSVASFIDELHSLRRGKNPSLSSEVFFFNDQLNDLLNFIQHEFDMYFDWRAKLPQPTHEDAIRKLSSGQKQLTEILSTRQVQPDLVTLIDTTIQKAMQRDELRYDRQSYISEMIKEIIALFDGRPLQDPNTETRTLLISLNFNSVQFFEYYTRFFRSDFTADEIDLDLTEKLALHFKTINQSVHRPGKAYGVHAPTIKDQLSCWLSEEIQYVQSRGKPRPFKKKNEDEFSGRDFKIEFDMSVSQFALLTRSFVESGVIQNKNIAELIRFLARFVKTKRSGTISPESLRIKYYDVENSTRDAVKNVLHTAIGYINSN